MLFSSFNIKFIVSLVGLAIFFSPFHLASTWQPPVLDIYELDTGIKEIGDYVLRFLLTWCGCLAASIGCFLYVKNS